MENETKTIVSMDASKLESLAKRVRHDIDLQIQSDEEWVQATLDLACALAEAKKYFGGNTKLFGKWFDECGFNLSKDDCAAYVGLGIEPERAREVLAITDRRSVREIYNKEFRVRSPANSRKPKTKTAAPKTDAALAAYDELKAAGVEPTREQVAEKAGVSNMPAQIAINLRKAEEAAAQEGADLSGFSSSAKAKVEAAVRKIQKRMDAEYEPRVREGIRKHIVEHIMPTYEKKLEMADRILAVGKKPFSIEEYRKLLAALHPDGSSPERRTEMFMIVKQRELLLRPADKDRPLSGDLPKTIEELLARRRKK